MLGHYKVKNPNHDKVLTARATLFHHFGQLALKIGTKLDQESNKLKLLGKDFSKLSRADHAQKLCVKGLDEIEKKYRHSLLEADQYPDGDIPKAVYTPEEQETPTTSANNATPIPKEQVVTVCGLVSDADGSGFDSHVSITEDIIMNRLGIETLPMKVLLNSLNWLPIEEFAEPMDDANGEENPILKHENGEENLPFPDHKKEHENGEEDVLFPDHHAAEAADVQDDPAGDVKDEPAADAKDVEPAPKRQKLDAKVNLYVAELIELRQSQLDQFPSGWLASIEYGGKTYEIDSDVLEEGFRAKDTTPKTPLEQKPGFDWNVLYQGMGEHIARTSLDHAFMLSYSAVNNLKIEFDPKSAKTLRVRAMVDFKPGKLVITPWVANSSVHKTLLASDDPSIKKNIASYLKATRQLAVSHIYG